jgi:hypothetical protein
VKPAIKYEPQVVNEVKTYGNAGTITSTFRQIAPVPAHR